LGETKPGFFEAVIEIFSVNFLVFIKQPAVVTVVLIMAVLFGGSAAGMIASRNAMPGDSLYIAKIISEKTRSTMTFNETDKAKLGVEFAGNRAKELSEVLAEPDNASQDKEQKVAELSDNFKKEINQVKNRLEKISTYSSAKIINNKTAPAETKEKAEIGKAGEEKINSDNGKIFRADTGKATSGIQISVPDTGAPVKIESIDAKKTLEEAEKLFDKKDLDGAIDKLEIVNNIIDNKDAAADEKGEVKGEAEVQATSTK
jgi:hypothetical protein